MMQKKHTKRATILFCIASAFFEFVRSVVELIMMFIIMITHSWAACRYQSQ